MRRLAGAVVVMGMSASVAGATGTVECTIADDNLTFGIAATVSRGMAGAIVGYTATAEVKMAGAPEGLVTPDLSAGLVHHWLDYPDLRLHLYAETQGEAPLSSMELIIETEAVEGEEGEFEGEYWLAVMVGADGSGIEAGGSLRCTAG